jgi:hypothetical protein
MRSDRDSAAAAVEPATIVSAAGGVSVVPPLFVFVWVRRARGDIENSLKLVDQTKQEPNLGTCAAPAALAEPFHTCTTLQQGSGL